VYSEHAGVLLVRCDYSATVLSDLISQHLLRGYQSVIDSIFVANGNPHDQYLHAELPVGDLPILQIYLRCSSRLNVQ
jgi:hypothetical protein